MGDFRKYTVDFLKKYIICLGKINSGELSIVLETNRRQIKRSKSFLETTFTIILSRLNRDRTKNLVTKFVCPSVYDKLSYLYPTQERK